MQCNYLVTCCTHSAARTLGSYALPCVCLSVCLSGQVTRKKSIGGKKNTRIKGSRSYRSGSKVKLVKVKGRTVKPSLKVIILAGGLTSNSSCFIHFLWPTLYFYVPGCVHFHFNTGPLLHLFSSSLSLCSKTRKLLQFLRPQSISLQISLHNLEIRWISQGKLLLILLYCAVTKIGLDGIIRQGFQ